MKLFMAALLCLLATFGAHAKPMLTNLNDEVTPPPTAPAERGIIGVEVEMHESGVVVIAVLPGSGAEAAGVLAGDIVWSVDGQDIKGWPVEKIAEVIGGDVGTTVNLGILRAEAQISLSVVRKDRPQE